VIQTPFYQAHLDLKAKMVDFAGWEMPVFYPSGIIAEHKAVRNSVGLFDIGHMGIITVSGKNALQFLQNTLTNEASKLEVGSAQYSLILNNSGGIIDDIFVYRMPEHYLIVLNASNTAKDIAWLRSNLIDGVEIKDIKDKMTLIAIQGPKAQGILQKISSLDLNTIGHHKIVRTKLLGFDAIVARTGYTGEDGFELFFEATNALPIWNKLVSLGALPAGLGARDTLRLEAGMPLYGHEYNEGVTPLETPFMFAVKLDKGPFIGRDALLHHKEIGIAKKLVGIKMNSVGIPRQGCKIFKDGLVVGYITSGTMSPTLNAPIGMGFIRVELSGIGTEVEVEIRARLVKASIVKIPFYKRLT
jgi:aminomethyltransferase